MGLRVRDGPAAGGIGRLLGLGLLLGWACCWDGPAAVMGLPLGRVRLTLQIAKSVSQK